MISQFIAAALGTVSFSLIFHVPKKYFPLCGVIGGLGWLVYLVTVPMTNTVDASFLATCIVVLLSRFAAIYKKCPVTIFLISGIFPLVPGAGIYWTAYYFTMNQYAMSQTSGLETIKVALAIVFGIIFVFEIPQGFFRRILRMES